MKLTIFFTAYVATNFWVYSSIQRADYASEERRQVHKYLIWILPFFGAFMIRSFWKKPEKLKLEVMTKAKRNIDKNNPAEIPSHDYQSFVTFWH